MEKERIVNSILVVGAGIAGIRAALELAQQDFQVILTESSPSIGGILLELDYQFPNNHCGLCRMLPPWERDMGSEVCMRKILFHENITIMPLTRVTKIEGEAGKFEVSLLQKARGVDIKRCIGCGRCIEVCPEEVMDEFNENLSYRKAIYQPVPHNLPYNYIIDFDNCTKCEECVKVCPTGAINMEAKEQEIIKNVAAIILAPGSGIFNPYEYKFYSYGEIPAVVTSLEMERILSGTGPTEGKILIPRNDKAVKKIAWLQCVGSRNPKQNQDYCSSICCMFALKEAMLVKDRVPDIDSTIFYMDMRTFGKDFYRYKLEAEAKGIKFVRCRVHTIDPQDDGSVSIRFLNEEGKIVEDRFDMVVLSTGQKSTEEMRELSSIAGISLDPNGFAIGNGIYQTETERPGIYVCGSFTGLKDISETVLQAKAAAFGASAIAKGGLKTEEVISFKDISREEPEVLCLICNCFDNLKKELPRLRDTLSSLFPVENIIECDALCQAEGFKNAEAILKERNANRLIIGACRPYLYDRQLRRLGFSLGIPMNLVDVVDIRGIGLSDQSEEVKLQLTKDTIGASLFAIKRRNPIERKAEKIESSLLVIGGGIAGMEAAIMAASRDIEVFLVEKASILGGEALKRCYLINGADPKSTIAELIDKINKNPLIHVFLDSEVSELKGQLGKFVARIKTDTEEKTIPCGAVIIATGGGEAETDEYLFGKDPRVITQGAMEEMIAEGKIEKGKVNNVVMIQCVGSRNEDRPYCSRVCCVSALKNALRLKEIDPNMEIYILYRDMMAYGMFEKYYTEARRKGIKFFTYSLDKKPEVGIENGNLNVKFIDPILGTPLYVAADLLVLSTGIVPNENNGNLAENFGVKLNDDGFFCEIDSKWRPLDLDRAGIFVCGVAHSPMNMMEALTQARAASMRALGILKRPELIVSRTISAVKKSICSLCETCIDVCPFNARIKEDNEIKVLQNVCQGCGICVASCPNSAAYMTISSEEESMSTIEGLLSGIKLAQGA